MSPRRGPRDRIKVAGATLNRKRKAAGISIVDLATAAEVSSSTVKRAISRSSPGVTLLSLQAIVAVLEDLLHETGILELVRLDTDNSETEQTTDHVTSETIDQTLTSLRFENGSLSNALNNRESLAYDRLLALATRFGHDANLVSDEWQLRDFLDDCAEEYHLYRNQVAMLDERLPAIANLKFAAKDAAENLNFAEVESLLSRVDEVESTIAIETKVVRAKNSLLLGKPEIAFSLFDQAVELYLSVDQFEAASLAVESSDLLLNHAANFGEPSFKNASYLARRARRLGIKIGDCHLVATARRNEALALKGRGSDLGGKVGAEFLDRAIKVLGRTKLYFEKCGPAEDYARDCLLLGNAYYEASIKLTDADQKLHSLLTAISNHKSAFDAYSDPFNRAEWSKAANNLGTSYREYGSLLEGDIAIATIQKGVDYLLKSLSARPESEHPVDWAFTAGNLASAIATKASMQIFSSDAPTLLSDAIGWWEATTRVRTEQKRPVEWGRTQQNIAEARIHLAQCDEMLKESHLSDASTALARSHRVFLDTSRSQHLSRTRSLEKRLESVKHR